MQPRKILCPIDFSGGSQHAFRVAARLAGEAGSELMLVHAWFLPPIAAGGDMPLPADAIQGLVEDAERGLAELVTGAKSLGVQNVTSELVSGPPWERIVGLAEPEDLIVMGTHGRTGIRRFLLGSVAEKVVRHAPCSVLVAREDGELKIYGAGIVSSFGESHFSLESPKPKRRAFDMREVLRTRYRSDAFQEGYFIIDSFEALLEDMLAHDFEALYAEVAEAPDLDIAR